MYDIKIPNIDSKIILKFIELIESIGIKKSSSKVRAIFEFSCITQDILNNDSNTFKILVGETPFYYAKFIYPHYTTKDTYIKTILKFYKSVHIDVREENQYGIKLLNDCLIYQKSRKPIHNNLYNTPQEWLESDDNDAPSYRLYRALIHLTNSKHNHILTHLDILNHSDTLPSTSKSLHRCILLFNSIEYTQECDIEYLYKYFFNGMASSSKFNKYFREWKPLLDNWNTIYELYLKNPKSLDNYLRLIVT